MVRYVIEQGKVGVLEKEKGEKARETLSEAVRKAWEQPEMQPVKKKLREVGRKIWREQIKEALEVTNYDKELKARAKEVGLDEYMQKAWGKE